MLDDVRRKIAAWLYPEPTMEMAWMENDLDALRSAYADLTAQVSFAQQRATEATKEIAVYKSANADMSERLAKAATALAGHSELHRRLRDHLMTARLYVLDVLNETEAEMNALSKRSKDRPAYVATIAGIKDDLAEIDDVLGLNKGGDA